MRVTIRLFARPRDIVGTPDLTREIQPGTTVRGLWRELSVQFPALAGYEGSMSSAVNADYAPFERVLEDGDEVVFLPPVSGG